jgi:AraC family transcriptional regulator
MEKEAPTWLHHVIALLDAAVRQIDRRAESARSAVISASSLLRKQVDAAHPEVAPCQRERLLLWQARKVRHYIDEHISEALSVADLAALIELSESHFSRSFKRALGVSPYAFVIRRRLECAIQYMLETTLPLSDIALRCGFVDQPHLSRHFRETMGHTPAAWRRERLMNPSATPHGVTQRETSDA